MMLKKFTANALAAGLVMTGTLTAPTLPVALAADANGPIHTDPNGPIQTDPNFVPGKKGSSPSGSSFLDATVITGASLLALKLLVDNVPVLTDALDKLAAATGMGGSSGSSVDSRAHGGITFNLETIARNLGQTQLAESLHQLSLSSAPAPTAAPAPTPQP